METDGSLILYSNMTSAYNWTDLKHVLIIVMVYGIIRFYLSVFK